MIYYLNQIDMSARTPHPTFFQSSEKKREKPTAQSQSVEQPKQRSKEIGINLTHKITQNQSCGLTSQDPNNSQAATIVENHAKKPQTVIDDQYNIIQPFPSSDIFYSVEKDQSVDISDQSVLSLFNYIFETRLIEYRQKSKLVCFHMAKLQENQESLICQDYLKFSQTNEEKQVPEHLEIEKKLQKVILQFVRDPIELLENQERRDTVELKKNFFNTSWAKISEIPDFTQFEKEDEEEDQRNICNTGQNEYIGSTNQKISAKPNPIISPIDFSLPSSLINFIAKDLPSMAFHYTYQEEFKTLKLAKLYFTSSFLNYTKWDVDQFMLTSRREGIQEFFLRDFYHILFGEFLPIDWSKDEQSSAIEYQDLGQSNIDLLLSDGGKRSVNINKRAMREGENIVFQIQIEKVLNETRVLKKRKQKARCTVDQKQYLKKYHSD